MLPIVHYAVSRSQAGVYYAIRRHPGGQYVCDCPRYQFSKKPKHCSHTEWAWYEEERMNQQKSNKPNLDGYVEVKDRIAQFLRDYPEGRIWTEWIGVQHAGDADWVVVKAYVARTPEDPHPATGIAWERVPGLTPYTKNSEAQNAETSAVGRAIAFVSERYAERGVASREEVRNRQAEREAPPPLSRRQGGLRERLDGSERVDTGTGEIVEDETDEAKYERYIAAIARLMDDRGHKVNVDKLAAMPGVRDRFDRDESASKTASWLVDIANARKANQEAMV